MTDDRTFDTFDLGPQALIVARLAAGTAREQLDRHTPCPGFAVHNMLGHLGGLAPRRHIDSNFFCRKR
ncbi:maleylpyruvate isomerase N-terminal domain-containing protein [Streptomyces sp. NBC_01340]|uniref:maleylpyruvate isomerase N-terminal domain-containing protein n=1 Tax=unclassified Streptomyces TaxID=2593676 RepID=UPI0022526EF0|nr:MULTISPECIES: maleylpyruvate isomerase N-terminal domain-containing protein [unclassified Streptomyces]MCX4453276.1 maleylpyruvate isomerase N-terminal domain-containing protein [Streptomyces sp. NBC_01719]MCX4492636.1 maleylpyruvate isomerase N-terminal domain-containing protein [Streptomyces sp. NBC_01728]MCX4592854.1 maleylpyruvate isomerase N-terminal domain-containing protein [Streptomyces sp. NBC_01549]WSI37790.1 maleylpyruvate isomerase N-terminal domain-containing protein [Streptomyc